MDGVKDGSAAISAAVASVAYTASSLYTHMAQDTTGSLPYILNKKLDYVATYLTPTEITDKLIELGYLGRDANGGVDVPNVSTPMAAATAALATGLGICAVTSHFGKNTSAYKKIEKGIVDEIMSELGAGKDIDSLTPEEVYRNVCNTLDDGSKKRGRIFKDVDQIAYETLLKDKGSVDVDGSYMDIIKNLLNPRQLENMKDVLIDSCQVDRLSSYLKERDLKNEKIGNLKNQKQTLKKAYDDLLGESKETKMQLDSLYSELDNQKAGGYRIEPVNLNKKDRNVVTLTENIAVDANLLFERLGRGNKTNDKTLKTRPEAFQTYANDGKETSSTSRIAPSARPLDKVITLEENNKSMTEAALFGALGHGKKPDIYKKPLSKESLNILVGNKNEPVVETPALTDKEYAAMFKKSGIAGKYGGDFSNWKDSRGVR